MKQGSFIGWAGVLIVTWVGGGAAFSAPPPAAAPSAADLARLESELARVQQDLREQRALIFQLMEMHTSLLKYLHGGAAGGQALPPLPSPSAGAALGASAGPSAGAVDTIDRGPAPASTGTISGTVRPKGGPLGEAYVYVDGPKVLATRA